MFAHLASIEMYSAKLIAYEKETKRANVGKNE